MKLIPQVCVRCSVDRRHPSPPLLRYMCPCNRYSQPSLLGSSYPTEETRSDLGRTKIKCFSLERGRRGGRVCICICGRDPKRLCTAGQRDITHANSSLGRNVHTHTLTSFWSSRRPRGKRENQRRHAFPTSACLPDLGVPSVCLLQDLQKVLPCLTHGEQPTVSRQPLWTYLFLFFLSFRAGWELATCASGLVVHT